MRHIGRQRRTVGVQEERRVEAGWGRVLGLRMCPALLTRGVHPCLLLPVLDCHSQGPTLKYPLLHPGYTTASPPICPGLPPSGLSSKTPSPHPGSTPCPILPVPECHRRGSVQKHPLLHPGYTTVSPPICPGLPPSGLSTKTPSPHPFLL